MAEGRTLGDPETVHYGLVPRTNRGIFAVNELPDLAERIQVALLNVLEERDIQVRGYSLRLPLDLLLVASANPEDYTNRGRIITPLKDRFGAEIRTHYPLEVDDEVALIRQEAAVVAEVPEHLVEVLARFTRRLRESSVGRPALRRLGPVRDRRRRDASPASALRRAARVGDAEAGGPGRRRCRRSCRRCAARSSSRWARRAARSRCSTTCCEVAIAETFRARLAGLDLSGFTDLFAEGGDRRDRRAGAGRRPAQPGRHGAGAGQGPRPARPRRRRLAPGRRPPAVEFVLEGLHLTRRIAKDTVGGRTVYGA